MNKSIHILAAIIGLIALTGCANIVFVSDRDNDLKQIYKMSSSGQNQNPVYPFTSFADSYPDVSPDGKKVAYISVRPDGEKLITRDLDDASGSTEMIITDGAAKKIWPRWSCQQNLIAFAEFNNNQARIFRIPAAQGSTPSQITSPGANQSDSGGHDFFEGGNKIVFSRSQASGNTWDLFFKNADGTGSATAITTSGTTHEVLPVVSHDGSLLAYLSYVQIGPGWPEKVYIVNVGTWTPVSEITLQPPVGARKIGALAFSHDDQKLYVATKSADVAASSDLKKYEIFSVKLDGADVERLTANTDFDSYPSAIAKGSGQICDRCVKIGTMPVTPTTQEITHNDVVFKAAKRPDGSSDYIRVKDFCPTGDGVVELEVGWSAHDTGAAEHATINFPYTIFGDGPAEVEITGCDHHSSTDMQLKAYDKNGNLLSTADHTAGPGTPQMLTLNGGNISRIDVIGQEIGLGKICYRY